MAVKRQINYTELNSLQCTGKYIHQYMQTSPLSAKIDNSFGKKSSGYSVGIIRPWTQATEFVLLILYLSKGRGSVVGKALSYKPEGRGFEIR
jgi:hypothetical protein